ncbi:unnamed protein product [Bursaphelenchus xylophilus]|uniref:(pine wood nematode) hypothetical protein n=1 Tax=Bursaphelenchus xylophilus TaxID=6326 RepID=A0A1I7SVS6_BURXY|nr:unnamed protein product [Bursaphelenchus xylophilus]CAG9098193.1 unnamed protein product [Bursaphelenchus xylophilus]
MLGWRHFYLLLTFLLQYSASAKTKPRSRRGPAVWGAPVPDYSEVYLDGQVFHIYGILFADGRISEHYQNDTGRVQYEIMHMVREANKYFAQLDIRLVIVDILPTYRNDLSLYSFEEYRQSRLQSLPYHDFAGLVSYRYAGGLAFVNGMCSTKSVMLSGFYPHSPEAMGSIFFHEVSHLLGVSHADSGQPINVPNCGCPQGSFHAHSSTTNAESVAHSFVPEKGPGCLRIPGFDHNCTAQLLSNILYRNRCLSRYPRSYAQNKAEGYPAQSKSDPAVFKVCGNGVVESSEECDCGLPSKCSELNCNPVSCTRIIPLWKIYLTGLGALIISSAILTIYVRSKYQAYLEVKKSPMPQLSKIPGPNGVRRVLGSLLSKVNVFRCMFCADGKKEQSKPYVKASKLDPASIVVIRDASCLKTTTQITRSDITKIQRPRCPPPSCPITSKNNVRPKVTPPRPPPPSEPRRMRAYDHNITYKFADFDD